MDIAMKKNELLSVLILDDEYLVRELLKRSVEWEAVGMKVVAESSSAMEALEIIDELHPQVVFADICMPVMDGLEFSRRVLTKNRQTKIIILTGHDEFDYARECVKLGVSDFLLKPVDRDEIHKVLISARDSILQERNRTEEYEKLKDQIKRSFSCLKERLLNDLLISPMENGEIEEKLAFYGISLEGRHFQVAVLSPSPHTQGIKGESEEERLILRMRCLSRIEEYYLNEEELSAFYGPRGNIVLLNSAPELDLSDHCEVIRNNLTDLLHCSLATGIGGIKEGLTGISLSYDEANRALEYTAIEGRNAVVLFSDINLSSRGKEIHLDRLLRDFSFALGAGLKEKCHDICRSVLDVQDKDPKLLSIRSAASSLISVVLNKIVEGNIATERVFTEGDQPYQCIFQIKTFPEMNRYLRELIDRAVDAINSQQNKRVSKLVSEVGTYLKENYHKADLSQTEVARLFHVNSSYLSRKFKQETGESFVDYLAHIRIEQAVNLFKTTDKRNYEVADEVGIADPHYFSIFFKRHIGMSISDYRKRLTP